ncbi:hypothetical protein C2S52_004268 [Perilla frutescens var. hirtella]|nr:hypothetical protein C2S52_004268 [Perilla frutescens var. hirtella]
MESHLCFNINGRVFEFGPVEFALLTGLKFSGKVEPLQSSIIHILLFMNRTSLKFSDIKAAFQKECGKSGGRSLLSLKLAFLFVLFTIVLRRDRKEKIIEMQYMYLADDLKSFEDFPWGRVSYDYLVRATHSRHVLIDNLLRQEKKMAYDVFGFVLALQTWAYETMPDLGRDCAIVVKRNMSKFPRMLRWRVDEFYPRGYLMSYFAAEFNDHRRIMRPSREEWEHLQRLGLQERHLSPPKVYVNPPSKRKAVEVPTVVESKKMKVAADCLKDRLRSAKGKEKIDLVDSSAESKRKGPMNVQRKRSSVTLQEIDAQMKVIGHKLDGIESLLQRCKFCWKGEGQEEAVDDDAGVGAVAHEDEHAVGAESEEEHAASDGDEEILVDMACVNSLLEEVFLDPAMDGEEKIADDFDGSNLGLGLNPDKIIGCGTSSPPERPPTRSSMWLRETEVKNSKEHKLVDEEEDAGFSKSLPKSTPKSVRVSATKSVARQLFGSNSKNYDLFDSAYKHIHVKTIDLWQCAALNKEPEPETSLPIISNSRVRASWFKPLWGRRDWLVDEHIDALINLLLFKYKRSKDCFISGWGVIDSLGTGMLRNREFNGSADTLYNYISGKWPRECGLSWVELRQVMDVANVNKNQWVCYLIEFESQSVTIFDSMREENTWAKVGEQFEHMLRFIPWLCSYFYIWEGKQMREELREVWELKSNKEVPQQSNSYDCGIMALKFLECLACGHPLTSIDPGRCDIFRRSYCAQLYELGLEFPAPK